MSPDFSSFKSPVAPPADDLAFALNYIDFSFMHQLEMTTVNTIKGALPGEFAAVALFFNAGVVIAE